MRTFMRLRITIQYLTEKQSRYKSIIDIRQKHRLNFFHVEKQESQAIAARSNTSPHDSTRVDKVPNTHTKQISSAQLAIPTRCVYNLTKTKFLRDRFLPVTTQPGVTA